MTIEALVVPIFSLCNALRVLAYVPQIWCLARPRAGTDGVSCTTWSLFMVSHLSTVAYLAATNGDQTLFIVFSVFSANALACLTIVGLTIVKRRGEGRLRRLAAVRPT